MNGLSKKLNWKSELVCREPSILAVTIIVHQKYSVLTKTILRMSADEHARQNFIVNTNISGFRFSDSEIFLAHACILA